MIRKGLAHKTFVGSGKFNSAVSCRPNITEKRLQTRSIMLTHHKAP